MFTFGEQIYRTTERDEETLLVDPFFRTVTVNIGAGLTNATGDIPVPPDRCLFVHSIQIGLPNTALSTWSFAEVLLVDRQGALLPTSLFSFGEGQLQGDNNALSGVGVGVRINRNVQLVLPPFISAIRFLAQRVVTTNAAVAILTINGYTIPPGRIGRA